MTEDYQLNLGVIEGFFGRSWSWQNRRNYADFLKENGHQFYIYAPKEDAFLRKRWDAPWPPEQRKKMAGLVRHYQDRGVQFGVGLSPYEIYLNYDAKAKAKLQKKIDELNAIKPDILCILFDDMKGDLANLAQLQADILHQIAEISTAKTLIMCPTYYSDDPILLKVFGQMPKNYLEDLGCLLDPHIHLFWTGAKVISQEYPESHLKEVAERFQRKPLIWDNCLANDGEKQSKFLHLKAFKNHPKLAELTNGHMINPMNQACLSRIPLQTLWESYTAGTTYLPERVFLKACQQLCGSEIAHHINEDRAIFQDQGLDNLDAEACEALVAKYQKYPDSPYAGEIVEWLKGGYQFDPACLTD